LQNILGTVGLDINNVRDMDMVMDQVRKTNTGV